MSSPHERSYKPNRPSHGFTLIEILVSCGVVSLLLALTLSAVQGAREAGRRAQCSNNIHMIALAMQNYLSQAGYFPPILCHTDFGKASRGASAHSYSVLSRVLSHLDQAVVFNAVNFANVPEFPFAVQQNRTVMTCSLELFLCPSDSMGSPPGFGRCNYHFSVGPTHTIAPGSRSPESFLGPFTTHFVYRASDFQDGLSNTVGVSERLQGDWSNGSTKVGGDYYLTSPRAVGIYDSAAAIAVCSSRSTSAPVESRGGESWFLSGFHFTNFNHCVPPNSKVTNCALDDVLDPLHARLIHAGVFPPTSYHHGGVNAAFMDGSVRYVRNAIDIGVWRAIGTRAGGEVVNFGD